MLLVNVLAAQVLLMRLIGACRDRRDHQWCPSLMLIVRDGQRSVLFWPTLCVFSRSSPRQAIGRARLAFFGDAMLGNPLHPVYREFGPCTADSDGGATQDRKTRIDEWLIPTDC